MKALLEAVYSQLKGDADVIAVVGGRIYAGRTSNHKDMPYLVFSRQGSWPPQYYTDKDQVEHVIIRFDIWSTDGIRAVDGAEAVEKTFRTTYPALGTGTCILVTKQSCGLELDPEPTSDGDDVWRGILDLDFMVQRDPTT